MSYRPGTFPFMSFPLEVRRRVYFFAVIRKRPIRLLINYHGLSTTQTLGPGRVRLYTTDFQMLFTCREFRKEMTDVLYAKNAWDISLFMVEFDEGTKFFQIDLSTLRSRLAQHHLQPPQRCGGQRLPCVLAPSSPSLRRNSRLQRASD